ncbi:MAG: hypothetical protein ACFFDN_22580, partial [Candidatus Hodarchaeota archaeon]
PYQKLNLNKFTSKFFPQFTTQEAKKYYKLKPEKLILVTESKLKSIAAVLKPLDDRQRALEFQKDLFEFFSIYSPKKLKKCQKILKKTPRGIREEFFSEDTLKLAKKKSDFTQKHISELMQLWLNMRYFGAMSMGLCPQFLIPFLNTQKTLTNKIGSIQKALDSITPEIETKSDEYKNWVFTKTLIDNERKMMTFGPESLKIIINCLNSTYFLSVSGEISKAEAEDIIKLVKEIIKEVKVIEDKENKKFISEENEKAIDELLEKIHSKPKFFFIVAQITNTLIKDKDLNPEQKKTLLNLINVTELLPENSKDALENDELKRIFGIVFEPLENLLKVEDLKVESKATPAHIEDLKLLNESMEKIALWIIHRIIEEKKPGLNNILDIFDGIPTILGNNIVKFITTKKVKLNLDKFKECIIEHLSRNGIYEIYSGISADKKEKITELEVADEIIIPPEADMRLAPINKQIKFEFMKFLEIEKLEKKPLFNVLETSKIIPMNLVDMLLNTSQDLLVNIINSNAKNELHKIINADRREYEVKLKTLSLKLKPLMQKFDDALISVLKALKIGKQLHENVLLSEFKSKIEKIWINSLISKKKIVIEEKDISTSKVSDIAAKLEAKIPKSFQGPPSAPQGAPPKGPPSKLPAVPFKGPPSKLSPVPSKGPPLKLPPVPSKGPPSKLPVPLKGPPSKLPSIPSKSPPPKLASIPSKVPSSQLPLVPSKKAPLKISPEISKPLQSKIMSSSPLELNEETRAIIQKDLPEVMIDTLEELHEIEPTKTYIEVDEEEKKKIFVMQKTIQEVEDLLESYTEEVDKFSPNEIKGAFKLLARVHKVDIENVTPKEIREIITLAEELKVKRDVITAQLEYLKTIDIEKKLSEASIKTLESKLELIVRYFDDHILEIQTFIEHLGEKTEFYLKEYQKKAGKAYWLRLKIGRLRIELKESVQFLVKFAMLTDESMKNARQYYSKMEENRKKRRNKIVGQNAQKLAKLLNVKKKKVLELTRQSELKASIEEIFKIRLKK